MLTGCPASELSILIQLGFRGGTIIRFAAWRLPAMRHNLAARAETSASLPALCLGSGIAELFTKHLRNHEYHDRAKQAAAENHIKKGVTDGSNGG